MADAAPREQIDDVLSDSTRPLGDRIDDALEIGVDYLGLSMIPHAIRRGAITKHLSNDVPDKVVGDKMNVSLDVLEKHYDRRGEREKAEQRREYLDDN